MKPLSELEKEAEHILKLQSKLQAQKNAEYVYNKEIHPTLSPFGEYELTQDQIRDCYELSWLRQRTTQELEDAEKRYEYLVNEDHLKSIEMGPDRETKIKRITQYARDIGLLPNAQNKPGKKINSKEVAEIIVKEEDKARKYPEELEHSLKRSIQQMYKKAKANGGAGSREEDELITQQLSRTEEITNKNVAERKKILDDILREENELITKQRVEEQAIQEKLRLARMREEEEARFKEQYLQDQLRLKLMREAQEAEEKEEEEVSRVLAAKTAHKFYEAQLESAQFDDLDEEVGELELQREHEQLTKQLLQAQLRQKQLELAQLRQEQHQLTKILGEQTAEAELDKAEYDALDAQINTLTTNTYRKNRLKQLEVSQSQAELDQAEARIKELKLNTSQTETEQELEEKALQEQEYQLNKQIKEQDEQRIQLEKANQLAITQEKEQQKQLDQIKLDIALQMQAKKEAADKRARKTAINKQLAKNLMDDQLEKVLSEQTKTTTKDMHDLTQQKERLHRRANLKNQLKLQKQNDLQNQLKLQTEAELKEQLQSETFLQTQSKELETEKAEYNKLHNDTLTKLKIQSEEAKAKKLLEEATKIRNEEDLIKQNAHDKQMKLELENDNLLYEESILVGPDGHRFLSNSIRDTLSMLDNAIRITKQRLQDTYHNNPKTIPAVKAHLKKVLLLTELKAKRNLDSSRKLGEEHAQIERAIAYGTQCVFPIPTELSQNTDTIIQLQKTVETKIKQLQKLIYKIEHLESLLREAKKKLDQPKALETQEQMKTDQAKADKLRMKEESRQAELELLDKQLLEKTEQYRKIILTQNLQKETVAKLPLDPSTESQLRTTLEGYLKEWNGALYMESIKRPHNYQSLFGITAKIIGAYNTYVEFLKKSTFRNNSDIANRFKKYALATFLLKCKEIMGYKEYISLVNSCSVDFIVVLAKIMSREQYIFLLEMLETHKLDEVICASSLRTLRTIAKDGRNLINPLVPRLNLLEHWDLQAVLQPPIPEIQLTLIKHRLSKESGRDLFKRILPPDNRLVTMGLEKIMPKLGQDPIVADMMSRMSKKSVEDDDDIGNPQSMMMVNPQNEGNPSKGNTCCGKHNQSCCNIF